VAASSGTAAFTVAAPAGAALHVVRLELRDGRGRPLSENTYWRYGKPEDMRALNTLERTRLTVSTSGDTATVSNRGSVVAALVRLAVRDGHGERVLPATYDDNYFWLLPGESRTVGVSSPGGLGASGSPPRRTTRRPSRPMRSVGGPTGSSDETSAGRSGRSERAGFPWAVDGGKAALEEAVRLQGCALRGWRRG
jgi:Ig-like domain-containing protein